MEERSAEETIVSEDMAKLLMRKGFSAIPKCKNHSIVLLMLGPERPRIRHPDNRPAKVNVATKVRDILIDLREKRKLRIEERKRMTVSQHEQTLMERFPNELDVPVEEKIVVNAEDLSRLESTLANDAKTRIEGKMETLNQQIVETLDARPSWRGSSLVTIKSKRMSRALIAQQRLTKLQKFRRLVLQDDDTPLPRLRRLYESARSTLFRPTIRPSPRSRHPPKNKFPHPPQSQLDLLGKQVKHLGDRIPLRKITFYVLGKYPKRLPQESEFQLPAWAVDTLQQRGYTTKDVLNWAKVIRARNAIQAMAGMEPPGGEWPKFLVQWLLFDSTLRSQWQLVKIFELVSAKWQAFDQDTQIRALFRMAELSAKKLPRALPSIPSLLTSTDFKDDQTASRLYNNLLALTADAYRTKQRENYTPVHQLRNYIDQALIDLLGLMAERDIRIDVRTLRKIASAKLAEDSEAAISILELGKPKRYVELVEDMKGYEEDLALAYEVRTIERQLSSIEREFLKGHLLGRVPSKELVKRLATIENWRVSAEETFTAWLDFLDRRRTLGPAPTANWINILQICHDEWTFPAPFWEEAYELMEEDGVFPNTTLVCLVLKGLRDVESLDYVLERVTTRHGQRMNDQIWEVYLRRLSINHVGRALEIFLTAHTTDSAGGTMDTLNVVYWNTLLSGLNLEARRTNDLIWISRAFDLLPEMERLSIFPSQHTISEVCKLGIWGGDKISIRGEPAWQAALKQWHNWVVRPEDFGYNFKLPAIVRLIPSASTWRKYIRLTGTFGQYRDLFAAAWAMVRFGVRPDWELLLDLEMYMQQSGDEERTLAVREMFREWLDSYPSPGEVIWHHRKLQRRFLKSKQEADRARLEAAEEVPEIEGPGESTEVKLVETESQELEVVGETVVDQWIRRERAKPWFERR